MLYKLMSRQFLGVYYPHPVAICNSKSNVAIATCWSDPEKLANKNRELINKIAFVASINRKEGITMILNELYRFLHIDTLLIWPHERTSWIPDGPEGRLLLEKLWEEGINDNKEINNTNFRITSDLSAKVLRDIVKNTELVDIREVRKTSLINEINKHLSTSSKWFMDNYQDEKIAYD